MNHRTTRHPGLGISIAILCAIGTVLVGPLSATANAATATAKAGTPTWSVSDSMTAPVTAIQSVACPSSSDCYAVGENSDDEYDTDSGIILSSTNGGTTWNTQSDPAGSTSLSNIACPSTTTCYATGSYFNGSKTSAIVVGTTDSGATWGVENLPTAIIRLTVISCPSTTKCFAIGHESNSVYFALVTTDGGASWTTEALPTGMHRFYGISCGSDRVLGSRQQCEPGRHGHLHQGQWSQVEDARTSFGHEVEIWRNRMPVHDDLL